MNDAERNSKVLEIVNQLKNDNISSDEHDPKILEKYCNFASTELKIEVSEVEEIVNEAFLYLKMQQSTDIDPVKEGDRFAAGFS
tara:strand:- start:36543 stop:36794 length:252 start_codon:yes stop_codon:yes gene_type:complete